ncbi:dihydrodipicolinate synthase family protein [Desulfoferula mesophila]|uniref:Dihydrodipicolinate synthase family protein n=1 Tax=Desulfoferula mesophila TaxID=3058419 RepID=A0AAU9EFS0_9BACT|nr:dihydrodipicolinate synthase family protein [Desulfoferula mesophilus]
MAPVRGVLPPVVTPFVNEELDLPAFENNLRALNRTGLSGYVVLGSTGESVYLDEHEKELVLAAAREAAAPGKQLVMGTGQESTRAAIHLTRLAAKHGADFVLVVTPAYFKGQMTPEALMTHFTRVADDSPIPVLLYNVPQFTALNLAPEVVAQLAQHPNIQGIKDSTGDIAQLTEIIRLVPRDFAVLVGSDTVFYPALCVGATGGVLATPNVIPDMLVELFRLFLEGDHRAALGLQRRINPLANLVIREYGIGGLKLAMDMTGFQGGGVRSPLIIPHGARGRLSAELAKLRPDIHPQPEQPTLPMDPGDE